MDYVIITAILTFFILLYFLKIQEGYTDSYIINVTENITRTKTEILTTIDKIKDLTGTGTKVESNSTNLLSSIEKLESGIKHYNTLGENPLENSLEQITLDSIYIQRNYLNKINYNILQINKAIKDTIESISVSTVGLNDKEPKNIPLLTSLNNVIKDLNTVNENLKQIPD